MVSSVSLFAVIFFGLRYGGDFEPRFSLAFAVIMTVLHYLHMSWHMKRAGTGE